MGRSNGNMGRLGLALLLLAGTAAAQIVPLQGSGSIKADRATLNAFFAWLDANKAGLGTCAAGQVAVQITASGVVCASVLSLAPYSAVSPITLSGGGAIGVNVGTTSGTVAAGDDVRLSNARTPTAHAVSHATGGGDVITPASIGAQTAGTDIPTCSKYTTAFGSLTTAALTQAVTLAAIPARGQITSLRIKHSAQFAAPAITSLLVSLGDGTVTDVYAPGFQVLSQAASNTALWDDGGAFASTAAAHNLTATFTAIAGNLSTLTAGSVDVWACVRTLP